MLLVTEEEEESTPVASPAEGMPPSEKTVEATPTDSLLEKAKESSEVEKSSVVVTLCGSGKEPPAAKQLALEAPTPALGAPSAVRELLGDLAVKVSCAMVFMLLVSGVYALLMPWLLWRVANQPTAFVWTASVLISSYLFIGTVCLSVMRLKDIFFKVSYIGLLSVAASHFISSNSGATIATLLTFYTAWLFGRAIAEHISPVVSEVAVSLSQRKGVQKHSEESLVHFIFFYGATSIIVMVRMVWLVLLPRSVVFLIATADHENEALLVVEELCFEMMYLAWPWSCFVCMVLQEGEVVPVSIMLYKIPIYVTVSCVLRILLSIFVSKAAGLIVLWIAPIVVNGLFGYILSKYARNNQTQKTETK